MQDCFYCTKDSELDKRMVKVLELPASIVYLNRNQAHPGRCIVAYKSHVRELFELSDTERNAFMADVSRVAATVSRLYAAHKINYGVFGDLVSHLHFHIVPKRPDLPIWGDAFPLYTAERFLEPAVLQAEVERLRAALEG